MKIYNLIYLILFSFFLTGCIGPWYNPYPISKLVSRVGPPLKIGSDIPKELLSTEIAANSETQVEQTTENNEIENTQPEVDLGPILEVKKIDNKTIIADWKLDIDENLILPPVQVLEAVKKQCENNSSGHLLSFSSEEGVASATFKCW